MKIYRLMCDRCGTPYPLYDGYRFFVELDVTLRCCRTPQRLEMSEHAYPAQWRTVQVGITPRQWYALTGQPDVIVWTESE